MPTVTSQGSGNWNDDATWSDGETNRVPAASDDVIVDTGHTVDLLNGDAAVGLSLGGAGTLRFNQAGAGTQSLTISGAITLTNGLTIVGTTAKVLNVHAGSVYNNGASGGFNPSGGTVNLQVDAESENKSTGYLANFTSGAVNVSGAGSLKISSVTACINANGAATTVKIDGTLGLSLVGAAAGYVVQSISGVVQTAGNPLLKAAGGTSGVIRFRAGATWTDLDSSGLRLTMDGTGGGTIILVDQAGGAQLDLVGTVSIPVTNSGTGNGIFVNVTSARTVTFTSNAPAGTPGINVLSTADTDPMYAGSSYSTLKVYSDANYAGAGVCGIASAGGTLLVGDSTHSYTWNNAGSGSAVEARTTGVATAYVSGVNTGAGSYIASTNTEGVNTGGTVTVYGDVSNTGAGSGIQASGVSVPLPNGTVATSGSITLNGIVHNSSATGTAIKCDTRVTGNTITVTGIDNGAGAAVSADGTGNVVTATWMVHTGTAAGITLANGATVVCAGMTFTGTSNSRFAVGAIADTLRKRRVA